jgi:YD repeat-containing protein
MHMPLRTKSLLIFSLVYCLFFSCGQLIEIIKPTHPKPVQDTCLLVKESRSDGSYTGFVYDAKGRLVKESRSDGSSTEYTYDEKDRIVKESYASGSFAELSYDEKGRLVRRVYDINNGDPEAFRLTTNTYVYNDENQLISYSQSGYRSGFQTNYDYDMQGRLLKASTDNDHYFEYDPTAEYSYSGNTIQVNTTNTHDFEPTKTAQTTYVFENGNLVKMRIDKSLDGDQDGYEINYTYSSAVDKLPKREDPTNVTAKLFTSRNLVSKSVDSEGKITTYEREFNKQGYPVKSTVTSPDNTFETSYTYNCDSK